MTRRGPDRSSEAGTTLIELLVAVAIMGIAFVTILGGIGTAIIGADYQRRDATSGVVLTSAAEKIVADTKPYKPCAQPVDYQDPPSPSGFTVSVTEVAFWDGSSRFVPLSSCTPAADKGIQLIKLSLTPPSGPRANEVEPLEVVKRQVMVSP